MHRGYPDINFFDDDIDGLMADAITLYEQIMDRTLHDADPARNFIAAFVGIVAQTIESFNHAAKQNVPRFAKGEFLDNLGELFNIPEGRLAAKRAETILRFTIIPQEIPVTIPEGLGVSTVDSEVIFETTQAAVIPAGETQIDVPAQCRTPGTIGNRLVPGQILRISGDRFEEFQSVRNITETAGGAEAEDCDAFYERMRLSQESYSTAGPMEGYRYHALSATSRVSDVRAISPVPGEVEVRILLAGGELPDADTIQIVYDYLCDRTRRPLTDFVKVCAPTPVPFDVEYTYWLPAESPTPLNVLREDIQAAEQEYLLWQRSRIGRDIIPSRLHSMLMKAGARRVEIAKPVFTVLTGEEVAMPRDVIPHDGGIEFD